MHAVTRKINCGYMYHEESERCMFASPVPCSRGTGTENTRMPYAQLCVKLIVCGEKADGSEPSRQFFVVFSSEMDQNSRLTEPDLVRCFSHGSREREQVYRNFSSALVSSPRLLCSSY